MKHLILILAMALTVFACKKEEQEEPKEETNDTTTTPKPVLSLKNTKWLQIRDWDTDTLIWTFDNRYLLQEYYDWTNTAKSFRGTKYVYQTDSNTLVLKLFWDKFDIAPDTSFYDTTITALTYYNTYIKEDTLFCHNSKFKKIK